MSGWVTAVLDFLEDPVSSYSRMEESPPRYPHIKYEFMISGCRVIRNKKIKNRSKTLL